MELNRQVWFVFHLKTHVIFILLIHKGEILVGESIQNTCAIYLQIADIPEIDRPNDVMQSNQTSKDSFDCQKLEKWILIPPQEMPPQDGKQHCRLNCTYILKSDKTAKLSVKISHTGSLKNDCHSLKFSQNSRVLFGQILPYLKFFSSRKFFLHIQLLKAQSYIV